MSHVELLELAKERFRDDWTDADETLFRQTGSGEVADYGEGDPAEADKWGKDRVLRADRIVWLCTDRQPVKEVTHKGVQIKGARIDGELDLSFAKIAFLLSMRRSAVRQGMVMQHARLSALSLDGTHTGPIYADGLTVDYFIHMRNGFQAEGEVRLLGAKIGGVLDCSDGHFSHPNGKGDVFFRNGFQAAGVVRLLGAKIGGDLDCGKGHFSNPNGDALSADGVEVGGSVFLRGQSRAEGHVDFIGAAIGGYFQWRDVKAPDQCTLGLESAKIGTFWDEEASWPAKLHLDGLVYDRLDNRAPLGWKKRLEWLGRQDSGKFLPQPYVQLASVLQEMVHEADARKILIAKQKDAARVRELTIPQHGWHHVLGLTIGYGYRPWQALFWIFLLIAFGWVVFGIGFDNGGFVETKEGTVPTFNAFVYSLDAFVPLVDLHQAKYRLPVGCFLRVYLWVHIGFGWVLTTLLVVGLTGLVRK